MRAVNKDISSVACAIKYVLFTIKGDTIKRLEGKLNSEKQKVVKLKSTLEAKKAVAFHATHSFNAVVRRRLIESFPAKYLRSYGKENWRQVNMDMMI